MYNYDFERVKYNKFLEEVNSKTISLYGKTFNEMANSMDLDDESKRFVDYCVKKCPIDMSPSTMNKICWAIEDAFKNDNTDFPDSQFDYTIYKSSNSTENQSYYDVKQLCDKYLDNVRELNRKKVCNEDERKILLDDKKQLLDTFKDDISMVCPNEIVLCDTLLDMCYLGSLPKNIVWDVCGDIIVRNMLKKNNYMITYPEKSENADFWCGGVKYINKTIKVGGEIDD